MLLMKNNSTSLSCLDFDLEVSLLLSIGVVLEMYLFTALLFYTQFQALCTSAYPTLKSKTFKRESKQPKEITRTTSPKHIPRVWNEAKSERGHLAEGKEWAGLPFLDLDSLDPVEASLEPLNNVRECGLESTESSIVLVARATTTPIPILIRPPGPGSQRPSSNPPPGFDTPNPSFYEPPSFNGQPLGPSNSPPGSPVPSSGFHRPARFNSSFPDSYDPDPFLSSLPANLDYSPPVLNNPPPGLNTTRFLPPLPSLELGMYRPQLVNSSNTLVGPLLPAASIGMHWLDGTATSNIELTIKNVVDQAVVLIFGYDQFSLHVSLFELLFTKRAWRQQTATSLFPFHLAYLLAKSMLTNLLNLATATTATNS